MRKTVVSCGIKTEDTVATDSVIMIMIDITISCGLQYLQMLTHYTLLTNVVS